MYEKVASAGGAFQRQGESLHQLELGLGGISLWFLFWWTKTSTGLIGIPRPNVPTAWFLRDGAPVKRARRQHMGAGNNVFLKQRPSATLSQSQPTTFQRTLHYPALPLQGRTTIFLFLGLLFLCGWTPIFGGIWGSRSILFFPETLVGPPLWWPPDLGGVHWGGLTRLAILRVFCIFLFIIILKNLSSQVEAKEHHRKVGILYT